MAGIRGVRVHRPRGQATTRALTKAAAGRRPAGLARAAPERDGSLAMLARAASADARAESDLAPSTATLAAASAMPSAMPTTTASAASDQDSAASARDLVAAGAEMARAAAHGERRELADGTAAAAEGEDEEEEEEEEEEEVGVARSPGIVSAHTPQTNARMRTSAGSRGAWGRATHALATRSERVGAARAPRHAPAVVSSVDHAAP